MGNFENQLNIFWVLVSTALVMSMQIGFCMLESGLVRSKNSINVASKNIIDFCIAVILFWLIGYGLMFGESTHGLFGFSKFFQNSASGFEETSFIIFQTVFCATSATIVAGAVAERMSFKGYIWVSIFVSALIYPVSGHWVWGTGGWLYEKGFIDFAGSTVVHSVGGWVALAAVIVIGPRLGRFNSKQKLGTGHSLVTASFGVLILWFGWIGFNGGSTLAFNEAVPLIILNTFLAAAAGGISAISMAVFWEKVADLKELLNGVIAGLVSITACCHIVTPTHSIIIGLIGGILCFLFGKVLSHFKIDDVIGASSAHAIPGAWGTLAVGLLGNLQVAGSTLSRGDQITVQLVGIISIFAWSFGVGYIVLKTFNHFQPLRVDPETEKMGLNIAEHGASTELFELVREMNRHHDDATYSSEIQHDPFTEVGQISQEYNRVIKKVQSEICEREKIAQHLIFQKRETDEKSKKLLSSIEYAQTIQGAIFPDPIILSKLLPNHFVIHQAKDIVSGDFYWFHQTERYTFVAVIDCTGHGVPGAFMSMIGVSLLNQIVREEKIFDTGKILTELNIRVRKALKQDSSNQKNRDGMDACICRMDQHTLSFSGAKRPLYIYDPTQERDPLIILKGNRSPIGGKQKEAVRIFDSHYHEINPGLSIYLTSDGFVDQPNPSREPFDTSRFTRLLRSVAALDMIQQKEVMINNLDRFRGGIPYRDDITIFGLKIL